MVIKSREILLKDHRTLLIECASPQDAREILAHMKQTAAETDNLIRCPEEFPMTEEAVEKEAFYLKKIQADPKCLMLSAILDGKIAGISTMLPVGNRKKTAHRGGLSVAVLKEAWKLGIGQAMMDCMEAYAGEAGYTQLELSVLEHNAAAYALYRKLGYQVYGTLPNAVKLNAGSEKTMILMYKEI